MGRQGLSGERANCDDVKNNGDYSNSHDYGGNYDGLEAEEAVTMTEHTVSHCVARLAG